MQPFATIYANALARKGKQELESRWPKKATAKQLAALPDDRYLAAMTRPIFQAGFAWKVIESKWPGFEEAFHGFDPRALVALSDKEVDALGKDTRIVRNLPKIRAVLENAEYVLATSATHGGFGRYVAAWPSADIVGLWAELKRDGSRLGGDTGPRFLRAVGKDTFILSGDVVTALVALGVVSKKPSSKRDLAAVQAAFNAWHDESGRDLGAISVTLACTVASAGY